MLMAKVDALREWWSSAVLSLSKDRASALPARIETQSRTGEELDALLSGVVFIFSL